MNETEASIDFGTSSTLSMNDKVKPLSQIALHFQDTQVIPDSDEEHSDKACANEDVYKIDEPKVNNEEPKVNDEEQKVNDDERKVNDAEYKVNDERKVNDEHKGNDKD